MTQQSNSNPAQVPAEQPAAAAAPPAAVDAPVAPQAAQGEVAAHCVDETQQQAQPATQPPPVQHQQPQYFQPQPQPQPVQQVSQQQAQPVTIEAAKAAKAERSQMIRARAFKAVIAGALVLIAISGFKIASALNYQTCIEVAGMKYGTASASSLAGVARRNAVAECSGGIL